MSEDAELMPVLVLLALVGVMWFVPALILWRDSRKSSADVPQDDEQS